MSSLSVSLCRSLSRPLTRNFATTSCNRTTFLRERKKEHKSGLYLTSGSTNLARHIAGQATLRKIQVATKREEIGCLQDEASNTSPSGIMKYFSQKGKNNFSLEFNWVVTNTTLPLSVLHLIDPTKIKDSTVDSLLVEANKLANNFTSNNLGNYGGRLIYVIPTYQNPKRALYQYRRGVEEIVNYARERGPFVGTLLLELKGPLEATGFFQNDFTYYYEVPGLPGVVDSTLSLACPDPKYTRPCQPLAPQSVTMPLMSD